MTLDQILGISGAGLMVLLFSLIKIKPLEISIWHWLARKVGKAFNGETLDAVSEIRRDLTAHIAEHEQAKEDRDQDRAETNRQRILRFSDEMYDGKYHSKESFDDIIEKIDQYDRFCETHPEFSNGRTVTAAKVIKAQYEECLAKHTFSMEE